MILDTALILFSCVAANHLGLISAIEKRIKVALPVLNCGMCLSFWCTLSFALWTSHCIVVSFAVSFLNAYLAIWLELGMGIIDRLYDYVYDKVYTTTRNTDIEDSAVRDEGDTDNDMPDLWQ